MTSSNGLLTDHVIVVTGATRGLGRATALALAGEGANLVLNGRGAPALAELANDITKAGGQVATVAGSVAEEAVAQRLIGCATQTFGKIDCLINNAGIVRDRTLLKMTSDEFDDVIAVNLRGTWLCGRYAAEAMKHRGGTIINVSSSVALHGSVGQNNYAASKAGVVGLMRAWSEELARYAIRVNAFFPIAMTEMTEHPLARIARHSAQRGEPAPTPLEVGLGDPAEVATALVFLASDLARDLNAQMVGFNGRRLSVYLHSQEAAVQRRSHWTPRDIAAAFEDPDGLAPQRMHTPDVTMSAGEAAQTV